MGTITSRDGTAIYYKDWGAGHPVVFCPGWPLSADAWESQMVFLAANGYRGIAHDRRGHGRSSQPWNGNDMDTYADDLSELIEMLDLYGATLIGHSTGGGEVARYIGRHGTQRVAKVVLLGSVTPLMLKTDANPGGLPIKTFDDIRAGVAADRSQFFRDLTTPLYGANRPGAKVSQGVRDAFWLQGMQGGLKNELDSIKAFSETDFSEDLKGFDVPTLDQLGDTGKKTGFWLEEFAAPYFVFKDAGAAITLASPKGGQPPLDPTSSLPGNQTKSTLLFRTGTAAQAALANTRELVDMSANDFDAVFYPGGHGTMWDLPDNATSTALIEAFVKADKPVAAARARC